MAGTVARLIPGHWLGGRSTLDRARGFIADPYSAAAQTESAKVAQGQSRGDKSLSRSSSNIKNRLDSAASNTGKTNSNSFRTGSSYSGSTHSTHNHHHMQNVDADSDSDSSHNGGKRPFNLRRVTTGGGKNLDVVDVHETFEIVDLAAVSTAEINFQQSAERCPLGTLARSMQMLPDGTSFYTTLLIDPLLVTDISGETSTAAGDRPPFQLRVTAGKNGNTSKVTSRWLDMHDLSYPIINPKGYLTDDDEDLMLKQSIKLGNPLIDLAGFLCNLDIPVQTGETLIATRLVPGDFVQRFIGDVDAGSIHAALRSPLGLHPSIQIRGVYVISLWARAPKSSKDNDDGYKPNSRPVTAEKGVTLARGELKQGSAQRRSGSRSRSPRSNSGNSAAHNTSASSRLPTFRIRCQYLRHPYGPFLRTEIHDARMKAEEIKEQAFLAPSSSDAFITPPTNSTSDLDDEVITGNMIREIDQQVLSSVQQQQNGATTNISASTTNNHVSNEQNEVLGRKNAAMLISEMQYWMRTGNMPSSKRVARIIASANQRHDNPSLFTPYPKVRFQQNDIEPVYEYDLGLEELSRADLNPFIERKESNLYGIPTDLGDDNHINHEVFLPHIHTFSTSKRGIAQHHNNSSSSSSRSNSSKTSPAKKYTSPTKSSPSPSKSVNRTVSASTIKKSPTRPTINRAASASPVISSSPSNEYAPMPEDDEALVP